MKIDPIIERFRFAHHNVAMMFAAGLTIQEVQKRTGFTPRRLSLLLDDPTFCELIEHYRKPHVENLNNAIGEASEMMAFAHSASLRQICDRLEDADEEGSDPIPLPHLIKIHGEMADRTGFSKHSTKTVLNIDFATALDRAIERSGKAQELRVIESPLELPRPSIPSRASSRPKVPQYRRTA
jgi:hypothetical protein